MGILVLGTEAQAQCADSVAGHNVDALVGEAGSIDQLLFDSRGQLAANLKWFAAMGPVVQDPVTPLMADVKALYEQGRRAHENEIALKNTLECRLGLPITDVKRPPSVEALEASAPVEAAPASSDWFDDVGNALGAIGTAIGTVSGALNGAGTRGSGGRAPIGGSECANGVCY